MNLTAISRSRVLLAAGADSQSSFAESSSTPTLQSQPSPQAQSQQQMPRRLLIVEDDSSSRSALQQMLSREGWQVDAASTVAEAKKALKINPPDFMVLDLMLPDGDGVLLLEHVRATYSHIRVAVTTGVLDPQWLRRVDDAQPTIVLKKPIEIDNLLACLRKNAP
jgi:DNA-binding response OmpR family regulator